MARKRALSAREVDAIKATGVHWVAPSLYMQIRLQGTRSWLFRCSIDGKNHWAGLGACRDVPLTKARDEADRRRLAVRAGADPAPPCATRDQARCTDVSRGGGDIYRIARGRLAQR